MQTDGDFAKKIIAAKDLETARQLISGEGYEFTFEEFKTLQPDLSDETLEEVSGGTGNIKCSCAACDLCSCR
jgi:predicted ribosomally synthesized peptide with nif11-like leader